MLERWKTLLGEMADEEELARFQEELDESYISRADAQAQADEAEQEFVRRGERIAELEGEMAQREERIVELEGEMAQREAHITELEGEMAKIRMDAMVDAALIKAGAKNVRAARALLDMQALTDAEDALPLLEEQIAQMQDSDGYLFEQKDAGYLTPGNFARKRAVPDEGGLTYSQAMRLRRGILN